MFIDEQANPFSFIYHLVPFVMALALTGALVLAGCDSTDVTEPPEIADVVISPDSASLAVGEQIDFSVVALTASGDTVRDANPDLRWESSDPAVFTVEDNGMATGQDPGEAFCRVWVPDDAASKATHLKAAKRTFDGLDSAFVSVF